MSITRAQIEERLAKLRAEAAQLQANLNAFRGAIEDCEYWLEQVEREGEGSHANQEGEG